jgi:hypothetical protein
MALLFSARFEPWPSDIPRDGDTRYPLTAGGYGIEPKVFRRRPARRGSPQGVDGLRKFSTTPLQRFARTKKPDDRVAGAWLAFSVSYWEY